MARATRIICNVYQSSPLITHFYFVLHHCNTRIKVDVRPALKFCIYEFLPSHQKILYSWYIVQRYERIVYLHYRMDPIHFYFLFFWKFTKCWVTIVAK